MSISINVSAPGAIPDLTTLKSTISDWLDRTDLDDKIPQFVQFAEDLFNREIRAPQMEKTSIGTASTEDTPLPADYLAMRAIYEEGSPDRPLKAISPTAIRHNHDGTAGTPVAYALVSNGIRLVPPPASEILLTMDYWAQIPPLSVYAPTNWLLQKYPSAYLYAALAFAEDFLDNDAKAQKYLGFAASIIERINRASRNDRYGAGPLVPTTVTQVRGSRC